LTKQTDSITNAERRVPPHTQGVVELLRRAGHRVLVRKRASDAGLAYKLNDDRWRTALQLTNRARRLGII
jgi:alanine dehydrogenase